MTKIVFFGTSDYCLPAVESLLNNFSLIAVVTKPPPNPVYDFAKKKRIAVFTPANAAQLSACKSALLSLDPDLAVVADYGLIIPEAIFRLPKNKTVNLHFSRLPEFRGPSPVQYSILFGKKESWISVILMDEKIDTGQILEQIKYPFSPQTETTRSLYAKLFRSISQALPEIIKNYLNRESKPFPQDEKAASYTRKLVRSDGFVPFDCFLGAMVGKTECSLKQNPLLYEAWQKSSCLPLTLERAARAFDPWPSLWTLLPAGKRLKLLRAKSENQKLVPESVQLEGKKSVSWRQFQQGYPDFARSLA